MTIRLHHYTAADMSNAVTVTVEPTSNGPWQREYLGVVGVEGECSMTDPTPRRDQRGITADTLRTWTGTDSELARRLGVTRQAVCYARRVHKIPAPYNGNRMASPTLSKTVVNAIVREARRRNTAVAKVLMDLNVWADSAVGPEVDG